MSVEQQLKALEQDEARLARKKQRLIEQLDKQREAHKELDALVANSGYKNARELIKALAVRNGLDLSRMGGTGGGRKTRARMTAATRDQIKTVAKGGKTAYAVSKELGISYPVVKKAMDGGYDHL